MHHEAGYFLVIDAPVLRSGIDHVSKPDASCLTERHVTVELTAAGALAPIGARQATVGASSGGRMPLTKGKPPLAFTGKARIAPRTNKPTPTSEGGPLRFILLLSFARQMKKAIRGPKRPRMASMPQLSVGHTGLHDTANFVIHHPGVIGWVRTFSPCT
jgi:hypothetical protein